MRDRRFYRRISRPNNSRKACNEMIRCLSDYSTAVGGYLVNLVSHRPTCLGIRVGSFRALIQHTEVDMLVTSRRSGSQNVSRKIMLVQQYRTSTWWRNLNAFVTNRTHLPMKLCSNKALRGNLCVDLRTEVTCARSVSHLPTVSHARPPAKQLRNVLLVNVGLGQLM